MKIFGFNINIHSDIEEMDMRDTIVAVMPTHEYPSRPEKS